ESVDPASLTAKPAGAPAQVLVVDDDPDVRSITSEYLRDRGHVVREAEEGEGALALIERNSFAAVVSDIMMPGRIDGLELALICRQRWPKLPVVLVSGFSAAARDAEGEGLTVLQKPYAPEVLASTLNEMMEVSKG